MVFLREELRARHKSVWLLEWGLGRVVQRGLGYMYGDISWGLFEEKVGEVKEGQGRNLLGGIRGAA